MSEIVDILRNDHRDDELLARISDRVVEVTKEYVRPTKGGVWDAEFHERLRGERAKTMAKKGVQAEKEEDDYEQSQDGLYSAMEMLD